MSGGAAIRTSCDSVVALGAVTATRTTIFAKNSDRIPDDECQPLRQLPAADHPASSRVRCQYIEIDQARHTHAALLSSPYWLWGAEHGVNEHGVAIGNHTIFTKDPVADVGLLGMDLVRLGLERGASALEAAETIIALIERHGQGGSGFVDKHWPYHNSFLIADPKGGWLLEASAKNWALARVTGAAAASNHASIGREWERLSAGCVAHAASQGWCDASLGTDRFDFAAAYRDLSLIPAVVSSGRHRVTCEALRGGAGRLDVRALKRLMRDHFENGEVYRTGRQPDDERFFSVCRHDAAGVTTASMVAELREPERGPQVCWVAFCNPCTGPYLPVLPAGRIPVALTTGGASASQDSAWWRFKTLLGAIASDPESYGRARSYWAGFETEVEQETERFVAGCGACDRLELRSRATEFMDAVWKRTVERIDSLEARLAPAHSAPS
jgi:dipeptidase